MGLLDFANLVKRETRYGSTSVSNDQPTQDILARLNLVADAVWAAHDWPWALEELSFAITTTAKRFLVASASGALVDRITELVPQDASANPPVYGAPLDQLERRDFYAWWAAQAAPNGIPGTPQKYVNLGLDPAGSGKWYIEIAPMAATAFTMGGWAKKIRTDYTLANLQANATMYAWFPKGIVDYVFLDGVKAGIYEIQGDKAGAARSDSMFQRRLAEKIKEQASAARDNSGITTPPPDSQIWKRRMRSRGGTGVY